MKISWKVLKLVFAFVVIAGVVFWAFDSIRTRSYSGTNLTFDVSGGLITLTNPSDQPVAAQLLDSGSRTFRVTSSVEGLSGSSTREGSGSERIQRFEFELPPGTSEFTVVGGADVRFVAEPGVDLRATVNPMSSDSRRVTLIAAAVVIAGVLFFVSSVTQHQWINSLRPSRRDVSNKQDTQPTPVVQDGGQGPAARSYGDNRAKQQSE